MFAVSYVATVSTEEGDVVRVRRIRVFGRECNLLSTSERTDGLEQCLAWRPGGGSLIASTQRLPNKHQVRELTLNPTAINHLSNTDWAATCAEGFVICFMKDPLAFLGGMSSVVQLNGQWNSQKTFYKTFPTSYLPRLYKETLRQVVFFEKNGLRHGEFRLPFGPNDVVVDSLAWNRDGDALAVCCKERDGARKSHLLVYTCSNYHWSLKQSWEFAGELQFFPPFFTSLTYGYRLVGQNE